MAVDYRRLRADEVDAAADLWLDDLDDPRPGGPQHQAWRRQFRTLPYLLSHTWVAVAPSGALLSIGRYWPLRVHDAEGMPQRVGRISHVFTLPIVRRQGHATHLLELMIAAMVDEGCQWSILSASDDGRSLYELFGWRALPLRRIRCVPSLFEASTPPPYAIRSYDPDDEVDGWMVIQRIHRAYNTGRPLTTIRDDGYWRNQKESVRWWLSTGRAHVLVALEGQEQTVPCAYALVVSSPERGPHLAECGAFPDKDDALFTLLYSIMRRPEARTIGVRLRLPWTPALEETLTAWCSFVEHQMGGDCMVRAIAPDVDALPLEALPTAPGAVLWLLDDV